MRAASTRGLPLPPVGEESGGPTGGSLPTVLEFEFFGKDAAFHHVGLAVPSIRAANAACDVVVNRTEGVSMAFMRVHGITIELLEPLGDRSPIARSLHSGTKLLHLCFEVPDLETALESCLAAGFHRASTPVRVPEFGNRRIVWVFHKHYGLFELVEQEEIVAGSSPRGRGGHATANVKLG